MNRQQGKVRVFEIILTVLLISIVAAVLFPRGTVVWERAKLGNVEYMTSSLSGAVKTVRMKWLINKSSVVRLDQKKGSPLSVLVNTNGWPIDVWAEQEESELKKPNLNCKNIWNFLLKHDSDSSRTGAQRAYYQVEQVAGRCIYTYTGFDRKYFIDYIPGNGEVHLKTNESL